MMLLELGLCRRPPALLLVGDTSPAATSTLAGRDHTLRMASQRTATERARDTLLAAQRCAAKAFMVAAMA
jgi:hypothetical protein